MRVSRKAFRVVTTVILMLAAGCGGSGTTAPASDPPRVLDAAPGNGTSGVGIHKAVMVLFDRAMDNASFDNATVTLSPDIPGTITCTGNLVRFQPLRPLEADRTYQFTIGGGVRDKSGNALGSPFTLSFRTSVIPIWEGSQAIASSSEDYALCVAGGKRGDAYVAGKTRGSVDNAATNRGGYDLFAARYSPSGSRLWTIQFGTAADDNVTGIAVDDAGNVYVCGFTSGGMDGVPSFGGIDAFVVKFNDNGVKLWSRQLGTSNDDFAFGIAADAAGNLFVAGATYGLIDNSATAGGGADMMLARLDASGNLLWVRQRGTPAWTRQFGTSAEDVGTGVAVDAIGDAFVSAYSAGGFDGIAGRGLNDGYLVKYRADGERQ